MKIFLLAIMILVMSVVTVRAAGSPGFAPNGVEAALLTVNQTQYEMSAYVAFSVYSPVACIMRLTAGTSRNGSISEAIPASLWTVPLYVNRATPYLNLSGCTGGVIRRMK